MPYLFDKRPAVGLKKSDGIAFEKPFINYNQKLFNFADKMLHSGTETEGIIQNTFTKLWETRSGSDETHSSSGYLLKMPKNEIFKLCRKRIYEK
jgi:DNA-directed RNA polymerase specialized sigma24 family protein